MRRRPTRRSPLVLAALLAGCTVEATALGAGDGGGSVDAPRDAAQVVDAPGPDGGEAGDDAGPVEPDAGPGRDAGADAATGTRDASAPHDGGGGEDAGPPDAGPPDACVAEAETCNGVDDDCDGDVDEGDACPCEREVHRGRPYLFCDGDEERAFDEALTRCEDLGYHLVIVEDGIEDGWVIGQARSRSGDWWIGLTDADDEGDWRWIDGSELTFENWSPGEPNDWGGGEDCAEIWTARRAWNDERCGDRQGFVCELAD